MGLEEAFELQGKCWPHDDCDAHGDADVCDDAGVSLIVPLPLSSSLSHSLTTSEDSAPNSLKSPFQSASTPSTRHARAK